VTRRRALGSLLGLLLALPLVAAGQPRPERPTYAVGGT